MAARLSVPALEFVFANPPPLYPKRGQKTRRKRKRHIFSLLRFGSSPPHNTIAFVV